MSVWAKAERLGKNKTRIAVSMVRLKPVTTYDLNAVRLKADTTYDLSPGT
jgi:hypothetical protein